MKVIVIGSNHAGTACVNTILDNYGDQVELTVYDKNDNISFLGCGMALWIGEQIHDYQGLFYSDKETLEAKGATVHMETEVVDIDTENKTVRVKSGDKEWTDSYDKLVLATGSRPREDKAPGSELKNIEHVKLFQDAQKVKASTKLEDINNVAVLGSGYIGIEIAEGLRRIGKNVKLITRSKHILGAYFDPEFSDEIKNRMKEHGIELHLEEEVVEYLGDEGVLTAIKTTKGQYDVDMAISAIGFVPNSELGGEVFERFTNGAYLVDRKFETNIEGIYAIGDCSTEYNNATRKTDYIALATNAVRSGIVAAHNVCGTEIESPGVQGSSALKIYDYNVVGTGLSLESAAKAGIEVLHSDYVDTQKPAFMEVTNPEVKIRIVYRKDDRTIVGAQLGSTYDVSSAIHLFSLAIQERVTIDKLALTDIFFMPHFNQPYNYITMAAVTAE